MKADRAVAFPDVAVLSGWPLTAVTTLVEREVNAARANGARGGPLAQLLEVLRQACAGCGTQPAQPDADAGCASWPSDDEIDVKEAARIMVVTESNIRTRCRRGTLPAVKLGGEWRLSRSGIPAKREAD